MSNIQQQIHHLFWRAGFGPSIDQINQFSSLREAQDWIWKYSKEIQPIGLQSNSGPGFKGFRDMTKEERQEALKMNRQFLVQLNHEWIKQLASSKAQLREKMTFFWHDHFACKLRSPQIAVQQNNTMREHALGKFGDLLLAVSKDPGMLTFLNNQQNKKAHPNENFARELLELFTLGRGHYSEKDIKEAARAFTGWSVLPGGKFFFRRRQHDYGKKEFLGRKGNFGGEEILNIILEEKQTALFITEKLYRYLVHPEPDMEVVRVWAKKLYESDYHIGQLLRTIFSSAHFYAKRNIGSRIKSPIEYLVGMMRGLDMEFPGHEGPMLIQRSLGQVLFLPPSVAGWPEQRAWIDASSLMMRLRIPQALILSGEMGFRPKESFAGNEDLLKGMDRQMNRRLTAEIAWDKLASLVDGRSGTHIKDRLHSFFIQVNNPKLEPELINQFTRSDAGVADLKMYVMRLLGSPEYQMC